MQSYISRLKGKVKWANENKENFSEKENRADEGAIEQLKNLMIDKELLFLVTEFLSNDGPNIVSINQGL